MPSSDILKESMFVILVIPLSWIFISSAMLVSFSTTAFMVATKLIILPVLVKLISVDPSWLVLLVLSLSTPCVADIG